MPTPTFSTGTPDILNTENGLSVSLPLLNTGPGSATQVLITDILLGTTSRSSPAYLPKLAGDLPVDSAIIVSTTFPATNAFEIGKNYLLSVRCTYVSAGSTHGLNLNRYILVPPKVQPLYPVLAAHAEGVADAGTWAYTVFNDEVGSSPLFVNALALDIAAPLLSASAPQGWSVDTDNETYVLWYATDEQSPYPNHIAPGSSLNGFEIRSQSRKSESKNLTITSWNHETDDAGLAVIGDSLAPTVRI
jgi:hypothetical protein